MIIVCCPAESIIVIQPQSPFLLKPVAVKEILRGYKLHISKRESAETACGVRITDRLLTSNYNLGLYGHTACGLRLL